MDKYHQLIKFIRNAYSTPEAFIPLHEPRFSGNEKAYVADAIDSTFVSSVGEYVNRFEQMMCDITGAKYAIATVNGTSALHVALQLAGVEKGDEVITQALSFIATANAINYTGARPVFLDVDRHTMGLSPVTLELWLKKNVELKEVKAGSSQSNTQSQPFNKITGRRIAAIVPMHTFGHPVELDDIIEIANRYNIPVVEDAAESLGSYYKNEHTGTRGILGAFSFNGNKTVTCGGGGAIVTNDEKLARIAKHITTTAKVPHPYEYTHDMVGYNYRMPNLNAALACAQLENLKDFVINKRNWANKLEQFCQNHELDFIKEPGNTKSNYWLNAICLKNRDERDKVLKLLNKEGVMCRPIWTLLYKMPMYADCFRDEQTNAQWLEDRIVNIPSSVI
ncbi:LegC family aminotransferase [Carboxylicivirga sp. A043]|uniref:LegC family aminotransferase n=1 Tax=Carboxylicivirga litoralis TaxID=2816963 RepID=UPI0021CB1C19|nr:LegC family aminotransferase [Carboxylicivirga sp. A043]MCU4158146.1 LegC family aminotransferase [Carboxylicivirga sp. A043]